jgi:hypothetical protein
MAKAAKKEAAKKAATKKSASEIRKEHIAHVTHKPAPEGDLPAEMLDDSHDGIIDVIKHADGSRTVKRTKRKPVSVDERLDRLEALHAALVVKLRPHGIHLESHDEQEVATAE